MSIINAVMRFLFDVVLYPFRELHPLVGLTLVSAVFGVFALLLFKWTSDQEKIDRVKNKIYAGLFEIRLFNDDLRAIFRAMFEILRHNATYIRLSLVPLAWMLVPFVLVMAQLQFHYGYQGLKPGDETLVTAELRGEWPEGTRPETRLEAPAGLKVEAGPVWVPSRNELTWRIAAEEWGDYELQLTVDGETVTKTVDVADNVARRSTVRPSSFLDQVLYAAEPPLPGTGPIARIDLKYPFANAGFTGWESELTWLWVFLVLSIVFAFALKKPLGVTL
jgi:hypothetical protein